MQVNNNNCWEVSRNAINAHVSQPTSVGQANHASYSHGVLWKKRSSGCWHTDETFVILLSEENSCFTLRWFRKMFLDSRQLAIKTISTQFSIIHLMLVDACFDSLQATHDQNLTIPTPEAMRTQNDQFVTNLSLERPQRNGWLFERNLNRRNTT